MKTDKAVASEWVLGTAIAAALVLLINPFSFWMPSAAVLALSMLLAVLVIGFAVFIWRERPRDEREVQYGQRAARVSYFIGGGVLLLAIVAQSLMHMLDPWLPAALGAMVLAKLVASAWWRHQ